MHRTTFFTISSVLFFIFSSLAVNAEIQNNTSQFKDLGQAHSIKKWSSTKTQINTPKYDATQSVYGSVTSINQAHGWLINHGIDGTTTLKPLDKTEDYRISLKLHALGYDELEIQNTPQQTYVDGDIVSYHWDVNLIELWINSEHNVEQWFALENRPKGSNKNSNLVIQMSIDTDLAIAQNGNTIYFTDGKGREISYDKLKVWDSTGHELLSQMSLQGDYLKLLVDDTEAVYPLTIDPIFTQQPYRKTSGIRTAGD